MNKFETQRKPQELRHKNKCIYGTNKDVYLYKSQIIAQKSLRIINDNLCRSQFYIPKKKFNNSFKLEFFNNFSSISGSFGASQSDYVPKLKINNFNQNETNSITKSFSLNLKQHNNSSKISPMVQGQICKRDNQINQQSVLINSYNMHPNINTNEISLQSEHISSKYTKFNELIPEWLNTDSISIEQNPNDPICAMFEALYNMQVKLSNISATIIKELHTSHQELEEDQNEVSSEICKVREVLTENQYNQSLSLECISCVYSSQSQMLLEKHLQILKQSGHISFSSLDLCVVSIEQFSDSLEDDISQTPIIWDNDIGSGYISDNFNDTFNLDHEADNDVQIQPEINVYKSHINQIAQNDCKCSNSDITESLPQQYKDNSTYFIIKNAQCLKTQSQLSQTIILKRHLNELIQNQQHRQIQPVIIQNLVTKHIINRISILYSQFNQQCIHIITQQCLTSKSCVQSQLTSQIYHSRKSQLSQSQEIVKYQDTFTQKSQLCCLYDQKYNKLLDLLVSNNTQCYLKNLHIPNILGTYISKIQTLADKKSFLGNKIEQVIIKSVCLQLYTDKQFLRQNNCNIYNIIFYNSYGKYMWNIKMLVISDSIYVAMCYINQYDHKCLLSSQNNLYLKKPNTKHNYVKQSLNYPPNIQNMSLYSRWLKPYRQQYNHYLSSLAQLSLKTSSIRQSILYVVQHKITLQPIKNSNKSCQCIFSSTQSQKHCIIRSFKLLQQYCDQFKPLQLQEAQIKNILLIMRQEIALGKEEIDSNELNILSDDDFALNFNEPNIPNDDFIIQSNQQNTYMLQSPQFFNILNEDILLLPKYQEQNSESHSECLFSDDLSTKQQYDKKIQQQVCTKHKITPLQMSNSLELHSDNTTTRLTSQKRYPKDQISKKAIISSKSNKIKTLMLDDSSNLVNQSNIQENIIITSMLPVNSYYPVFQQPSSQEVTRKMSSSTKNAIFNVFSFKHNNKSDIELKKQKYNAKKAKKRLSKLQKQFQKKNSVIVIHNNYNDNIYNRIQ